MRIKLGDIKEKCFNCGALKSLLEMFRCIECDKIICDECMCVEKYAVCKKCGKEIANA